MKGIAMNTPNQTQKDRARAQRINSSKFTTDFIGESGPINDVLNCGHTTEKFREGYDQIQWDKD